MQVGIFTKTFVRPTLAQKLDAISSNSLKTVQFDMECAGVDPMPDAIDSLQCDRIRTEMESRGITMAAVSGTYNMAHPDPTTRRGGLRCLRVLAAACAGLGTSVITLCTGTRNPDNMWRWHRDNDSPEAWRDMLESMNQAVTIADEYNVILGFEPEVANVVNSPLKGRRLLDEIQSERLKVIMDGANIFPAGTLGRMREVLMEAFGLLGNDIILAHAKDLVCDGAAGNRAAGTGLLDYDLYLKLLRRSSFNGGLILHGLDETEVASSLQFVRDRIAASRLPAEDV